ncbi:MAG TPA: NUDIX domain-containing protein, partial [Anaeromyxobacteraceae bacterium]|nr:NUDIX domain-containing protein [Anaeromyxobacteraceae bacterium]
PYTAGAVASIAFAVPAPAVDGNAARVLSRLAGERGDPRTPKVKRALDALAAALVDPERPGDWNQAVMELGATVCVPRRPRCARCPLASACVARRDGLQASIPPPRRRGAPATVVLGLLRVERGGRLLLRREPGEGLLGGLWGLPGFEVPDGEEPAAFLARHARARLGLRVEVGEEAGAVTRMLTHRRLEMRVHAARLVGAVPRAGGGWAFTSGEEASSLPASTAMRRAIEVSGGWVSPGVRERGGRKSPRSTGRP